MNKDIISIILEEISLSDAHIRELFLRAKKDSKPYDFAQNYDIKRYTIKIGKSYPLKNDIAFKLDFNKNSDLLSSRTLNNVEELIKLTGITFNDLYIVPVSTRKAWSYLLAGVDKNGNDVVFARKETGSVGAGNTYIYTNQGKDLLTYYMKRLKFDNMSITDKLKMLVSKGGNIIDLGNNTISINGSLAIPSDTLLTQYFSKEELKHLPVIDSIAGDFSVGSKYQFKVNSVSGDCSISTSNLDIIPKHIGGALLLDTSSYPLPIPHVLKYINDNITVGNIIMVNGTHISKNSVEDFIESLKRRGYVINTNNDKSIDILCGISGTLYIKSTINEIPVKINKVNGNLHITESSIKSLNNFPSYIDGHCTIHNSSQLQSLKGLESCEYIKGGLRMSYLGITSLDALPKTFTSLTAGHCSNLQTLPALYNNTCNYNVYLYGNDNLPYSELFKIVDNVSGDLYYSSFNTPEDKDKIKIDRDIKNILKDDELGDLDV